MEYNYPKFTPEMKKTHTILIPNMAITQFRLLEYALRYDGYKCEILGNCGSAVAQLGLKYVHNDTCYPALLVIGQFLDAIKNGGYCTSPTYIATIMSIIRTYNLTQYDSAVKLQASGTLYAAVAGFLQYSGGVPGIPETATGCGNDYAGLGGKTC